MRSPEQIARYEARRRERYFSDPEYRAKVRAANKVAQAKSRSADGARDRRNARERDRWAERAEADPNFLGRACERTKRYMAKKKADESFVAALREKRRPYARDYYHERLASDPEYREILQGRRKLQRQNEPFVMLVGKARDRARQKGEPSDLTVSWARQRWTGRCELTDIAFVNSGDRANHRSPSLDRIDSSKGYTKDNCRFVLWAVNRLKNNDTDDVVFEIAKAIAAKAPT